MMPKNANEPLTPDGASRHCLAWRSPKNGDVMRSILALILFMAVITSAFSKDPGEDQAKLVRHATAVGIRALEFTQADLPSLLDAEKEFTPEGWAEFKAKLAGWLNEKGAATFSSEFVPSGPALDVHRRDGVIYLTLPGVLKHESRNQYGGISSTRYRAEIDLQLSESALKVMHLKQRTCGGAGSHSSCR